MSPRAGSGPPGPPTPGPPTPGSPTPGLPPPRRPLDAVPATVVADLIAADRAARAEAQTRFDRPLVLEAGAGTGKTTTLVARLLAWCLGEGWEKAALGAPAAAEGAPEAANATAAAVAPRVLRRVVALTFTEAAAAEMAGRAARELRALGRGTVPEWLRPARLPAAPELARRARGLLAALDHLTIETIHAWCYRLLATHPLEAGVHPRLRIDADGRLLRLVIDETVESILQSGYGAPGDPHLLALAAQGCGPREVADALAALIDGGMTAAALRRDPFAGGGWARLRRRFVAACADLRETLAPRFAGSRLPNAVAIFDGLAALLDAVEEGEKVKEAERPRRPRGVPATPPASGVAEIAPRIAPAIEPEMPPKTSPEIAPEIAPRISPDLAPETVPEMAAGIAAEIARVRRLAADLLPPNLRKHLVGWSRYRFGQQEQARLGEAGREVAERAAAVARLLDHLDDLDPERLRLGRLALAPLLATVEEELRRRGIATFDSLLRGARQLLATHPEVRGQLWRAIDQLLVDEFQDTDATQCEVLRWIALDGPPAERPGLFLVGDPKQSIYGWRSADLRAYDGFVARVRDAGGEVLPLVENFRSVPAVLDEVARVVAPVMRELSGVQPPFAPLLPCERRAGDAGCTAGGRAPVEHWVSWLPAAAGDAGAAGEPLAPQAAAAAALEAEAIAGDLLDLHRHHGLAWRDAAVLLRSTGDLDTYLDAMRRAGIPFVVGRDKQYNRRREVVDAAALVRAVIDPGDHLALVTALRSPMIGVPDAALLPLWRHQLPRLLTELHRPVPEDLAAVRRAIESAAGELPAGVPGLEEVAGWELSLLAAVEHLAVLRESFVTEAADVFVERLRRLLLLDATAAARQLGAYRLANVERFFRRLLVELELGSGDVEAVVRALRDDIAAGRDAEEGKPPEGAGDAVQVLTIHGAKGLDFAQVYLAQLHRPGGGEQPDTVVGRPPGKDGRDGEDGAAGEDGGDYRLLRAATPGFDLAEARRTEVEAAERIRTLYVAMTRAKDRLVLAGDWPRRPAAARRKLAAAGGDGPRGRFPAPVPPSGPRAPVPHVAAAAPAASAAPITPAAPAMQARSHLDLLAWRPGCPDLLALWQEGGEGGALDAYGVAWRFPARATAGEPAASDGDPALDARLAPTSAIAAQAEWLAARRTAAAARMTRPYGAAASEEAHAQLREETAAGERDPGGGDAVIVATAVSTAGIVAGREAAMAAGAALHRALELWDLGADPSQEAERQRSLLPAYLSAVAAGEDVAPALPRCRRLLDRFVAGGLAERLRGLGSHVLARELPVLLAPDPEPAGGAGPVAYVSGAIDLLYREPGSGQLVVADYKTDEVAGADLARRAHTYASQGAAYARAVQAALDLAAPPRFELWFVHAGEVVTPPLDHRG